ncbi:MAG: MOSC domain-containing protein [Sinobacteraceae bacterium]|nr:MOSC domain-containing protein [Nevskiaceae bacterium]
MQVAIIGIYAGRPAPLPGDGRASAIFKRPLAGRVRVTSAGLEGDAQADRRVHGGPDKALHHFPADHYRRLAAAVPELASEFVPGAIGENLSSYGLTETEACIGDVYQLGSARVQLSQPRTPCWKIDKKFHAEGLAQAIAVAGIAGWYYRVLQAGEIEVGDALRLIERNAQPFTLARMWALGHELRPDPEELDALAATPGLAAPWVERLRNRAAWLRRETTTSARPDPS